MVVFPNGFLSYLCGPVSAQQNAVGLLNMSWLNYHMVALQPDITMWRAQGGNVLYYSLYGDKIFPYLMCITHAHEAPLGDQLTDLAYTEKRAMNSLQTSVEWPYGNVVVLLHVMQSKYEKKYFLSNGLLNQTLHQQFRIVFFIYNCYVCFNGNKFIKCFDLGHHHL